MSTAVARPTLARRRPDGPRPAAPGLARPSVARLTRVELRKMLDTRAGLWLQVAVAALTVAAVVLVGLVGDAEDHALRVMLSVAVAPASLLLPIVGILLVTSEWSQRTGMITFALVPRRSRVLVAKGLAGVVYALAVTVVCLAVAAVATLLAASGEARAWRLDAAILGQVTFLMVVSMLTGTAFGALLLASAPAIVLYFALPLAWSALVSLAFFEAVAPWLDAARALGPLTEEVLSAAQWGRVGTALALWLVLPLLVGLYRITRREVAG